MKRFFILLASALMIAATTPNMALDLPTVGITTGPEWATKINAAFSKVDVHDHSTGKGIKVTQNGLNITGQLEINNSTLNGIKTSRYFDQAVALSGGSNARSLQVVNGELTYINAAGNVVTITDGNGLNSSSLGGIGGDYALTGAQVTYDNSNGTYYFKKPDTSAANISARNLSLTENLSGITANLSGNLNAVNVTASSQLNGASAVIGANTGTATLSTTGLATLNSALVQNGLTVNGASSLTSTLGVTGLASLNGGLTVIGLSTLNTGLSVTGLSTLNTGLSVTGLATFNSGVTSTAGTTSLGITNITSTLTTSGTVNVNNGANFTSSGTNAIIVNDSKFLEFSGTSSHRMRNSGNSLYIEESGGNNRPQIEMTDAQMYIRPDSGLTIDATTSISSGNLNVNSGGVGMTGDMTANGLAYAQGFQPNGGANTPATLAETRRFHKRNMILAYASVEDNAVSNVYNVTSQSDVGSGNSQVRRITFDQAIGTGGIAFVVRKNISVGSVGTRTQCGINVLTTTYVDVYCYDPNSAPGSENRSGTEEFYVLVIGQPS